MKVAFSFLLVIFSSLLIASCSKTIGVVEELEVDADNDSFSDQVDCDDTNPDIYPGADEICGDGIDQDCNGSDLECGCSDNDNDGFEDETCGGNDCDDAEASIHPDASEICEDGIDQDCTGADAPCAVLDAPTLITPENEATNIPLQPSFSWSSVGADSYEVHSSTGNQMVIEVEVTGTSYSPPAALAGDAVHYWRVRGVAGDELGPWSPIWSFTTVANTEAYCGDGSCDPSENCNTCSSDCGVCPPGCGDGTCQTSENCSSCVADCDVCPPSCGDGTCQTSESCNACSIDCGVCPPTCFDGILHQDETEVDCGGVCGSCDDDFIKETSTCTECGSGSCSCTSDEYCSDEGVCLLTVPGDTFFVAFDGDNQNSGMSISDAWRTWQYAFEQLEPGDILYVMGGEWRPSTHVNAEDIGLSVRNLEGTQSNPIRVFNYPGQTPILNGEAVTPRPSNTGLHFRNSTNIHLKGLTIQNVYQPSYGDQQPAVGIKCSACENFVYENVVVHDVHGRGIEHADWNEPDGGPDHSRWINCDIYNLFSYYEGKPGNAADAFMHGGHYPDTAYFEGCRAWNYADDGFTGAGALFYNYKNCWAMSSKKYLDVSPELWNVEGNGFKRRGMDIDAMEGTYQFDGPHYNVIENCIAANCMGNGFKTDLNVYSGDYGLDGSSNALYLNNLAYQTGDGNDRTNCSFADDGPMRNQSTLSTKYYNNIEHEGDYPAQQLCIGDPSIYDHSNNTWDSSETMSTTDFVSTDFWEMIGERNPDGSLPDIDFAHLAHGSDLIDAGVVIPGYHCASAGAHPGEDCIEWYGSHPDIGPFESNYCATAGSHSGDDCVEW